MKHSLLFGILIAMSMHSAIVASDLPPVAVQQVSSPGRSYFYSGETVTFSGAGSYDQDESGASITYYEWYVDGAYKAGGSSKSTWTTSFSVASGQTTVSIKLRVRDDENNWSEQTLSYTVKAKPGRVYYLKDHLGSVRTSVDENGHVIGYDDYYAFGLVMPGRSSNSGNPNDNYKYTGHELDNEANLDLYYAGARYLDPVLGRWLSVDPYAAKFPNLSPYNYSFNNPINFYDPNGLYPIYIVTRSYAPFKSFGPSFARYHGDNRGHSLSRSASYRTSATINYDTETMHSSVTGGRSYSRRVGASEGTYSDTYVSNRSRGNNLDVHSYGNNADQPGSWDIDQFTKLSATIDGDIGSDHILNISGTISGDDFPNQESILYDSEGNALWLGNFATSGDKAAGPLFDLARKNEGDVNINVNINIKVNADGVFQGVMLGDELLSIEEWNKRFE